MVVWTSPPPAVLPPPLRRHVREMVGYRAEGMRPGVHRGLPSDTLTMVLAIGAPLRTATSWEALDAGSVDEQAVVLSGLHVRSALVLQAETWEGIQLAVSPLGARALFGAPAAGLPVDHWDAADLLGDALRRLSERLAATEDWQTRYGLVTDFLLGRLAVGDGAGCARRWPRHGGWCVPGGGPSGSTTWPGTWAWGVAGSARSSPPSSG
ncbi:hypothetical protein [Serinicoccus sp. CUA-874]|uniref:hypothetical protein n=1 Tax=Serinicoccus sp. CUA-874 TaxID=1517939 RepID=UPI0009F98B1E|nr:hypothetical protein [Serinicoccus sp. CUA-874]